MSSHLERIIALARDNYECGANQAATVLYSMVLAETPQPWGNGLSRVAHGEACVFMAKVALVKGKLGEAGDWYREALDADPRAAIYRADFAANVLLRMGLVTSAILEAERAVKIEPDNILCWRALGKVLHDKGDGPGALAAHKKAFALAPRDPVVMHDVGCIALDLADYGLVREMAAAIMDGWPHRRGDAVNLLAMAAYREGKHEEAIALYEEAIENDCQDQHMARWNQALPLHALGRYKEGWAAFEARGQQVSDPIFRTSMTRFTRPLWRGEPPPARLHLHAEMGYGDTLALVRYAPMLAQRGYDVRAEVNPSLVALMRYSMPTITVIEKAVDYPRALGIADFDYHIPMLSLPAIVGTEIDTVPWSGPYLKADPVKVRESASRLDLYQNWDFLFGADKPPTKPRYIGLCWSSGIRDGIWLKEYGRRKSMSFDQLAPLFSHDAQFVSLQCGPAADENTILPGLGREDGDWADTAALIECLDLVITVDSAVAHLAGAMGKPVWVMMHTEGSWHWMTARAWGGRCATESPWYPSARLFRQERPHEWGGVISAICKELNK